jgi:SNF2 family DNA or RNA helicase
VELNSFHLFCFFVFCGSCVQARAHRIGQTKPVRVIRLLSEGTVEEIIWKRARAKMELSAKIIKSAEVAGDSGKGDTGQVMSFCFGKAHIVNLRLT